MRLLVVGLGLSIASAVAAPAFANWFDGSSLHFAAGHKLLLGSALSPTPDDLCAIGRSNADHCFTDATRTERKIYVLNEKRGHYREVRAGVDEKAVASQATQPEENR